MKWPGMRELPHPCGCSAEVAELRSALAGLDLGLREVLSLLRHAPTARAIPPPSSPAGYGQLVAGLTAAVVALVPRGSAVLVVSRGDDRLLDLAGRRAGHFPQAAGGEYAGHHPYDSDNAVSHLEALREAGWRYLVFPATALWWLDHYAGLRRHLETSGRLLLRQDGLGVVYGLSPTASATTPHLLESTS